ncbi:hypothetical protein [Streptomyces marincola]|uniref:Uncharacterized protein n=1 Tax=Streptomyces marincola TaxID=2878388 RepID=A0A1W7CS05_9ACTN|nr:hypothetical protein [Streptomyces marincola]ARQ67502.1 hypothetical protein CAG99_00390 [Streptomyces marincola]
MIRVTAFGYTAACDICGSEYEDGEVGPLAHPTRAEALDAVTQWPEADAEPFVRGGHGDTVVCRADDRQHQEARAEAWAAGIRREIAASGQLTLPEVA